LNRQLSLPVSTISQWWVRRSSNAVVILASPNTLGYSPRRRPVEHAARLSDVISAGAAFEQAVVAADINHDKANEPKSLSHPCPCCGGRMIIIETFQRGSSPRYRPATSITGMIRIDTS
jgi:hypothetical protein